MYRQPATHFGNVQKALAAALHAAGSTDTEIGLAIGVSVNNIIDWRRNVGLPENRPVGMQPPAALPAGQARGVTSLGDTPADFGFEGGAPKLPTSAPGRSAPVPQVIGLLSPSEAQAAFVKAVQPEGDDALEIGMDGDRKIFVDLPELLTTRLLIQGNSGSGKSHLLRRLLEESTGIVQQVIIDPEGDFVGMAETFGYSVIEADAHSLDRLRTIALKVRQHRGSIVLNLDALDMERKLEAVAAFLGGLFDAPREHWFPVLVAVDEAQIFAPSADNGEDREIRKASQQAMTDLMCRGRKRGLAGMLATQRLAKLHKNVAAECSNFLMGRTFLDIDLRRAADLLGMEQRQVEQIRDLNRGEFLGLGPAISRRAVRVKVGSVLTSGKAAADQGLAPLPALRPEEMANLLLAEDEIPSSPPALRVVR